MTSQDLIINELKRRLTRYTKMRDTLKLKHEGKELTHFTYWGGYDLGYFDGIVTEIERMLDLLNEIEKGE